MLMTLLFGLEIKFVLKIEKNVGEFNSRSGEKHKK